MNAVSLLREQIQQAHGFLEATMEGVTPEQAHWTPPGAANPLAATYVHAVASEDLAVNIIEEIDREQQCDGLFCVAMKWGCLLVHRGRK